jgi:hypothetical protein
MQHKNNDQYDWRTLTQQDPLRKENSLAFELPLAVFETCPVDIGHMKGYKGA